MRDLVAAAVALGLFLFALGLISTLRHHHRARERERRGLRAAGRRVLAEIPTADGLDLFVADGANFYWKDRSIAKPTVRLVRILINGVPLATHAAPGHGPEDAGDVDPAALDRPEGIAHDRWDVLIGTDAGEVLVACGSVRERVSQELARAVFDAVKADMERRAAAPENTAGAPAVSRLRPPPAGGGTAAR
jgi:hypothetical protein